MQTSSSFFLWHTQIAFLEFIQDFIKLIHNPINDFTIHDLLSNMIIPWDYHITEQIVNGEVVNWIMNKFDEILNELEERNLRMP